MNIYYEILSEASLNNAPVNLRETFCLQSVLRGFVEINLVIEVS